MTIHLLFPSLKLKVKLRLKQKLRLTLKVELELKLKVQSIVLTPKYYAMQNTMVEWCSNDTMVGIGLKGVPPKVVRNVLAKKCMS